MQELLPLQLVANLRNRQKITVLEGDVTKDNLGLDEQTVAGLQKRISIFIRDFRRWLQAWYMLP
jgi:thioester reductase-like protein